MFKFFLTIIEYGEKIRQNELSYSDGADKGETIRKNMSSEENGPSIGCGMCIITTITIIN